MLNGSISSVDIRDKSQCNSVKFTNPSSLHREPLSATEKHREKAIKQFYYFLLNADFRIINPTIPDISDPLNIPTLAVSNNSGEVKARFAMNKDIVKPIPASIAAA